MLGYIKSEDYLLGHDQFNLRKNTLLEEIRENNLIPIIETVEETESKSRLRKLADEIVSYKDAIKALAEIGGAFGKGVLTGGQNELLGRSYFVAISRKIVQYGTIC
jgi:hypothetical protein